MIEKYGLLMAHETADARLFLGAYVEKLLKSEEGSVEEQNLLLDQTNPKNSRRMQRNKQFAQYCMKLARRYRDT